jgi:hypothetical protein
MTNKMHYFNNKKPVLICENPVKNSIGTGFSPFKTIKFKIGFSQNLKIKLFLSNQPQSKERQQSINNQ